MLRVRHFFLIFVAVALAGCATQKTPVPTGGSKSDGIVRLSFQVGIFEDPQVDWSNAQASAMARCAAWGYTGAEPFGGQTQQCLRFNGYGNCILANMHTDYQCTN
ncbi:MAG: hypothetical protein ACJAVR_003326 [Paracoccaceae bacterium]|jgi:hypothetical protein